MEVILNNCRHYHLARLYHPVIRRERKTPVNQVRKSTLSQEATRILCTSVALGFLSAEKERYFMIFCHLLKGSCLANNCREMLPQLKYVSESTTSHQITEPPIKLAESHRRLDRQYVHCGGRRNVMVPFHCESRTQRGCDRRHPIPLCIATCLMTVLSSGPMILSLQFRQVTCTNGLILSDWQYQPMRCCFRSHSFRAMMYSGNELT
jgi:hypothetical protein